MNATIRTKWRGKISSHVGFLSVWGLLRVDDDDVTISGPASNNKQSKNIKESLKIFVLNWEKCGALFCYVTDTVGTIHVLLSHESWLISNQCLTIRWYLDLLYLCYLFISNARCNKKQWLLCTFFFTWLTIRLSRYFLSS